MSFLGNVLGVIIFFFLLYLVFQIFCYLEENSTFVFNLFNPKLAKIRELEDLVGTDGITPYYHELLSKNDLPIKQGIEIIENMKKNILRSNDIKKFYIFNELNRLIQIQVNYNKEIKEIYENERILEETRQVKREQNTQRVRNVSLSTRTKVLERDNYTCQMCGRNFKEDGVKLEVDHILPVSKGGSDNISNLQTLCFECNRGKSDKILPNQQK